MDFAVPVDNSGKIKENEKRVKSLALLKNKTQSNMKVTVISIVIDAFVMIVNGLINELEELESELLEIELFDHLNVCKQITGT